MKTKLFLFAAFLCSLTFLACSDDDDFKPDQTVKDAFEAKYPSATHLSWEKKGEYRIADFRDNNKEMSAWFDAEGNWYMTETDLNSIDELPQAVKTAFLASDYAQWKIDDIDMLERKDRETIYSIEVENGKQETDLYYSADGILLKSITDNDDKDHENYLPGQLPVAVENFIRQKYPNARIIESETEKGKLEVDIIHDNRSKEVVFDSQYNWLYTEYDVSYGEVPQVVKDAFQASAYKDYRIDDIDYYETPDVDYYRFELESGNQEKDLYIDENGVIKQP